MFLIDTFSGSNKEIGRAWGNMWRHWIQAIYFEGNAWHHPHRVESKLNQYEEEALTRVHDNFPGYFIELEEASRASGLTIGQLCLALCDLRLKRGEMNPILNQCFQVGFLSEREGPVLGDIMDSARIVFQWWRIRPEKGFSHLSLTIPGRASACIGMNECGLALGNSSIPFAGADYEPDLLPHTLATRRVLEECSTASEAVQLITSLNVSHSYIFSDASGDLKGVQMTPVGHAVWSAEDSPIILTNHIIDPELQKSAAAHGYDPDFRNPNSEKRLARCKDIIFKHNGVYDEPLVRRILTCHDDYPDSICRDGNATSMIAKSAHEPGRLQIAERFPCQQGFHEYEIKTG